MSWRVVVINRMAKLDLRLNYMVVRSDIVQKVHLDEISVLIIANTQVSLTAALLEELITKKVKVIFCDRKGNPSSELIGYYGAHDTSLKLRQQIKWSEQIKHAVWAEIVRSKIRNQQSQLKLQHNDETAEMLGNYLQQIELNDVTNREGHAAKVYFNVLFYNGFSRSEPNNINAALNYGYAIILSACNREITANGYITQLGIHHDNVYNQFNLGSDLMETFRPFVDNIVQEMWVESLLEKFETEEKLAIINVLNIKVLFDGKQQVLNHAIGLYCKSVFDALNEGDVSLLKFPEFL